MNKVLNIGLMSNPWNWATIVLMLLIAGFALRKLTDWNES